jgi:hypothetical protein
MICPIKQLAYAIATTQPKLTNECDGKECAWWDWRTSQCIVMSISDSLEGLLVK